MKIIEGNTALRSLIPNTLATVAGEPSWYEKLYPYLEEAELWLAQNITGEELLEELSEQQDISPLRMIAAKIITTQALFTAIPALDLVLTPNGFGIVNTSNVAPASKDRVERLILSMETERDTLIGNILLRLYSSSTWLQSKQAEYFSATLFPNLSLCKRLAIREHVWEEYQRLRNRIMKIESVLAETYFSPEQMARFRHIVLTWEDCSPLVTQVIRQIQSLELLLVSDMQVHNQSWFDLVNIIREHEELFPEWHASPTAQLYIPKVFVNKKESHGYWF